MVFFGLGKKENIKKPLTDPLDNDNFAALPLQDTLREVLPSSTLSNEQVAAISTAITLISLSGTFDKPDVKETVESIFNVYKKLLV